MPGYVLIEYIFFQNETQAKVYLEKWAYETTEFLCRSLKLLGQDVKYLMYAVSWMQLLFTLKVSLKYQTQIKLYWFLFILLNFVILIILYWVWLTKLQ